MNGWSPRWLAWCASLDTDPDDPTLRSHEFIAWISERWAAWDAYHGHPAGPRRRSQAEHAEFDAWLTRGGEVVAS